MNKHKRTKFFIESGFNTEVAKELEEYMEQKQNVRKRRQRKEKGKKRDWGD